MLIRTREGARQKAATVIAYANMPSKLELKARLKELGIALEIEPVQVTIPVAHLQTHII
jgi:hypothetical protein